MKILRQIDCCCRRRLLIVDCILSIVYYPSSAHSPQRKKQRFDSTKNGKKESSSTPSFSAYIVAVPHNQSSTILTHTSLQQIQRVGRSKPHPQSTHIHLPSPLKHTVTRCTSPVPPMHVHAWIFDLPSAVVRSHAALFWLPLLDMHSHSLCTSLPALPCLVCLKSIHTSTSKSPSYHRTMQ